VEIWLPAVVCRPNIASMLYVCDIRMQQTAPPVITHILLSEFGQTVCLEIHEYR
jgi:hypothetical protein